MSRNHVRLIIFDPFKGNDRMKKYGRLRNFRLLQVIFTTGEHNIRDTEPCDLIRLLKQLLRKSAILIKVLSHSRELRSLSWKNKRMLHNI